MNKARDLLLLPEGSETWRLVFLLVAAILIFWQMTCGWRAGLPRAVTGLLSLACSYVAAWFLGPALTPHLRGVLNMPDAVVGAIGGAGAGLIAYGLAVMISRTLFKSTRDQRNPLVRFVYGASGSVVGLLVGVLMVWGLLIGMRVLGTVAEAAIAAQASAAAGGGTSSRIGSVEGTGGTSHGAPGEGDADARNIRGESSGETRGLAHVLAKLKASIELGPGEVIVNLVDPLPDTVYQVIRKLTLLSQSPESAERFLRYPGAQELANHPGILALLDDPGIRQLLEQRDFLGLIRNEKIVAVANDPELKERLSTFPLEEALEYSLTPGTGATGSGTTPTGPPSGLPFRPRAERDHVVPPSPIPGLHHAAVSAS